MKLYAVKRERNGVVEWLNVAEDDWEDMPIAIGAQGYVRLAAQTCGGEVVEFVPRRALHIACAILASEPSDDVDGDLDAEELADYYIGLATLEANAPATDGGGEDEDHVGNQ